MLRYESCALFRQRICASLLSGKTILITKIRERSVDEGYQCGLQDFEANFLRLVEKLCDGCVIEINETGTSLKFKPGILLGGAIKEPHNCGVSRCIGWFIEGIIPLAIFSKSNLSITFSGLTNDCDDLSVDILRNVTIPLLQNFGISGVNIKVIRRGCQPKGGGLVQFTAPIIRNQLQPIYIIDEGLVKRVRGVAFSSKISPTIAGRVVHACRGVLNKVLPDVHIEVDHFKGKEGGDSPGYSLSLVAETTSGALLSTERMARPAKRGVNGEMLHEEVELPETLGREVALQLLEEVQKGGVIDRTHQPLILMLMVLTPEDVSKVRFGGQLTPQAVETLRLLKDAFGVVFKIKADVEMLQQQREQQREFFAAKRRKRISMNSGGGLDAANREDDAVDESSDASGSGGGGDDGSGQSEADERSNSSEEGDGDETENRNLRGDEDVEDGAYDGDFKEVVVREPTILLSCLGVGFSNVNRKVT